MPELWTQIERDARLQTAPHEDAGHAPRPPLGLHRPARGSLLDAERIVDVDHRARDRHRGSVAAVVGPGHAGAGLMEIGELGREPRLVAPLDALGQHVEEARTHYQRALAIFEEVFDPRNPEIAHSFVKIGFVLADLGRLEEAVTHHQRALGIFEGAFGPQHDAVVIALVGLAEAALLNHEPDAAREHAERAVATLESIETAPPTRAVAHFVLARALWPDQAQRLRSRALAEQARDAYAEHRDANQQELEEVEAWLTEHPVP